MIVTTLHVLGPYARITQQVERKFPIPARGSGSLPNGRIGGFKQHLAIKLRAQGHGPRWRVLRRADTWGRAADDLRRARKAARLVFGPGFIP